MSEDRAPWTVKGLSVAVREEITRAARKQGESVAEWIERAARKQIAAEAGPRELPPATPAPMPATPAPDADLSALGRALDGLARAHEAGVSRAVLREAGALIREQARAARGLPPVRRARLLTLDMKKAAEG